MRGLVEAVLQGLVLVIAWGVLEEVNEPTGRGLVEGTDNVAVLGVVGGDVPRVELGLGLNEPDLWLLGPELWQLEADGGLLWHLVDGVGVVVVGGISVVSRKLSQRLGSPLK